MSIYRGAGGAGDAVADSASEALLVRELAIEAQEDADAAAASATAAAGSASTASTAATNASNSATAAATSATNASNSASAASTSATNAAASASTATTKASEASTSATNAATSASGASTSATNAASSATTATTQATNAASSASAASTSATNASNSASAASTSASNASTSATSASGSASSATTSASNASTSATNASNSATSASTSATTATTQAGIATTQASNASTSATNAASSATAASGSASTATTQSTNASNSASSASTSATNASNSASAASTSATNAANSATAAAASAASINPASIAITGGSINGTTVGATTPSTGKFTTLEATGVTTVQAGTVSAPAITTTGDTNTGIFFPAADTIAFTEGGVESMRITSAGDVGIGTSTPANYAGYKTLTINGTSTGGEIDLQAAGAQVAFFAASNGSTGFGSTVSTPLIFYTNNSERMRIDSSGNVGIGTTSVTSGWRFESKGGLPALFNADSTANTASYGGVVFYRPTNTTSNGNGFAFRFNNSSSAQAEYGYIGGLIETNTAGSEAGSIVFSPSNAGTRTERMRILSGGSVGINTSSPTTTLTVDVKANNYINGIDITNSNNWGYGSSVNFRNLPTNGGSLTTVSQIQQFFGGSNQYGLRFYTYNSSLGECVRITHDGFLKASNTGAYFSVTDYHELRSNANNNLAIFSNTQASGNIYGPYIAFTGQSPNNTTSYFLECADSAARATIRSNGGIANYQANDVNLSDEREKTNIELAGSYLSKICAIPVKTFNYIDQDRETDDGLTLGVIAQDVQAVAPELVMESNWAGKDKPEKRRLSIYQTDLQYALMKCIQEQQALITDLTTRLTALENK